MDSMRRYSKKLRALLSPDEEKIFKKLSTPNNIQDYLDGLPIQFGDSYHSPRRVLKIGKAHCLEGALLAAAVLAYHGKPPLLMDLRSIMSDDDHVITLFKERGRWGAISKTNHPILRFRDAVYASPRELAYSYFHEYAAPKTGKKNLREYSAPFDLRRYAPERWVIAENDLWFVAEDLDGSKHFDMLPRGMRARELRPSSALEIRATDQVEWPRT